VMVDAGGSVYLTDFGIARHVESTTTMSTAGTPTYMAPEQIRAEPVSPTTDIYALGVLLYEMLTGQRPFQGNEAGTEKGGATANDRIRYGHLYLLPPDPRKYNPNLPAGLTFVITKALAKHPEDRYVSALDFFNAICLQADGIPGKVGDHFILPDAKDALKRQKDNQGNRIQPVIRDIHSSKQRSAWLAVGGMVVCALIIIAFVFLNPSLGPLASTHSSPTLPTIIRAAGNTGQIPVIPNVVASRTTNADLDSMVGILQAKGITPDEQTQPGSQSYTVTVQTTDRELWNWGWCANSPIFLQKYLNAIQIEFLIDGVPLPGTQIRQNQGPFQDKASGKITYCYQWSSILSSWQPGREVHLDIQARFLSEVNDGTSTYPKGDYIQRITASVANHP